jgi:hypothetical protein
LRPSLSAALFAALAAAAAAGSVRAQPSSPAPTLALPIACDVGRTCQIQHYVDRDPGPAALDYRCGHRTYDRHDGLDIRVLDDAQRLSGVDVLAAASGRVVAVRDGVPDISIRAPGAPSVQGRECGNRVAVSLGGGWLIDYCHLAQGSLRVKPGDMVAVGQPLGHVGLSGNTEFPHLHFSVRHGAEVVDPFAPAPLVGAPNACAAQAGLWTPEARKALAYARGVVLNAGIAGGEVTPAAVEARTEPAAARTAPALLAYVRLIGLEAGDVVSVSLTGPDGRVLASLPGAPLDHDKAEWLAHAGARRPAAGWPPGTYQGAVEVRRGGAVAIRQTWSVRL